MNSANRRSVASLARAPLARKAGYPRPSFDPNFIDVFQLRSLTEIGQALVQLKAGELLKRICSDVVRQNEQKSRTSI